MTDAAPNAGATPAPPANPAAATPAKPDPPAAAAATASAEAKPPKVKIRKPKQRACDEKDDKGKLCCGHLKRFYDLPPEIEALVGHHAEVYRCEFCKTIYKPNLGEMPHSYTLRV
ncbi:MAG TPA: hypothetical protein VFO34_14975 [Candidatus Acidoferrales bacterium]|nr:hypothetical protein [Candidatus Acidoferrales bacterium]